MGFDIFLRDMLPAWLYSSLLLSCVFAYDPLILTEFIEKGDIQGGQRAAKVENFVDGIDSYSGYFTVDPKYDSNMFFWYFPSPNPEDPVVVWLQGGPGSSSLFGLFYENGPLMMKGDKVAAREYSWSRVSHLIYIDNPVGTGFSYTNSSEGYLTDEEQVGDGLYSTIVQFFRLFPHLRRNDLYITGESYGGKYVPAMAYTIHRNNPAADLKLNLKGVAIGDGFSDPINMMVYGDYLFQIGLIDEDIRTKFKQAESYIVGLIRQGKYSEANDATNLLLGGGKGSLFSNVTGIDLYYNYYDPPDASNVSAMITFLNRPDVQRRIHVRQTNYSDESALVNDYLSSDIMKSIAPWIKVIADNYRVVFYNGQLDIIVAYPLTVNFLRNFDWCGHDEYMRTPRKIWRVGNDLAGYTRTVKPTGCDGSLTEIMVRNAGHMVPHDQPAWAFDIISRLVRNRDF